MQAKKLNITETAQEKGENVRAMECQKKIINAAAFIDERVPRMQMSKRRNRNEQRNRIRRWNE